MSQADVAIFLGESSVKVEQTIKSCESMEQLEVARKMLINWCNLVKKNSIVMKNPYILKVGVDVKDELEDILGQQALKIKKELLRY